ncbi:MAG TPA: hypothetical protein DIT10_16705 [Chryseobacterium sp.]|uniref:hypothetical protein n=1 Tax=Chryseobacterium lactis TaxID=1241981 RepID=UPI000ED4A47C|nr:hypothetical protein [Chryseobacterium lactis]HCN50704.1 hypothetical protein [Chryseobacterium sp.]
MRKIEFQTVIHLLFLAVIASCIFSGCKKSKEKSSPVTWVLENTQSVTPIQHKKIIEIKAELIGAY